MQPSLVVWVNLWVVMRDWRGVWTNGTEVCRHPRLPDIAVLSLPIAVGEPWRVLRSLRQAPLPGGLDAGGYSGTSGVARILQAAGPALRQIRAVRSRTGISAGQSVADVL